MELNSPTTTSTTGKQMTTAVFELGQVVATPGAISAIEDAGQSAMDFLIRHQKLEQGDLCDEDHQLNQQAVEDDKARVLSAFKTSKGERIWVITEWDRSVTTILLPEEY